MHPTAVHLQSSGSPSRPHVKSSGVPHSVTMLAPAYLDMPPLVSSSAAVYAPAAMHAPPGAFLGTVSPTPYQHQQKSPKRTWLNRVTSPLTSRASHQQQMQHPAALLHRDYLQEYREKYGALPAEHRISQLVVDPWHIPVAHHVHPAVVIGTRSGQAPLSPASLPQNGGICACPGTKKLGKPCKKCGLRVAAVNKGGTVRGGTVRGGTKERPALNLSQLTTHNAPTISPMRLRPTPTTPQDEESKIIQADPYDIMRRSRLSLQEKQSCVRTRSKSLSPSRARLSFPPSIPTRTTSDTHRSRLDEWVTSNEDTTPPLSSRSSSCDSGGDDDVEDKRKSILECDVSAYELLSKYLKPSETDNDNDDDDDDDLSDNAILKNDDDTDDDNVKKWKTPTTIPRIASKNRKKIIIPSNDLQQPSTSSPATLKTKEDLTTSMPVLNIEPVPPPRRRRVKKSIKSILKKTSVSSVEDNNNPTATIKNLHFPTYQEFKQQRKKQVQFTTTNNNKEPATLGKCRSSSLKEGDDVPPSSFSVGVSERDCGSVRDSARSRDSSRLLHDKCELQTDNISCCDNKTASDILHCERNNNNNNREDNVNNETTIAELGWTEPLQTERSSTTSENVTEKSKEQETKPKTNKPKRREGGSIVHIRGDHHKLFIDTMRLRMAPHHRADSRDAFQTSVPLRMRSPTRPRDPPPPPPPTSPSTSDVSISDVIIVTSPDTTIVTVNDEVITTDTSSSNDIEYNNTLRINIGNNNELATILQVGSQDYEPIDISKSISISPLHESKTTPPIPHVCSKSEEIITISDTSIIAKVENKRRSKGISSSIESPYVSTSIKVLGPDDDNKWSSPITNIVVACNEEKKDESITDDDSSTRSKFYVTVEDEDEFYDEEIEDHYEMIRDPIYEEISEPQAKSIFEGASKYDILNYLVGAKERGIPLENNSPGYVTSSLLLEEDETLLGQSVATSPPCSELVSHVSDSSEDSTATLLHRSSPAKSRRSSAEIERNDSGVGSETSQSSRSRWLLQRRPLLSDHHNQAAADLLCEDCEQSVEPQVTDSGVVYAPLVCRKCGKRRSERREIITELLETEIKYGRDLRIMTEEFYRPMLVAGLLSQDQLDAIFLNVPELLDVSRQLSERLQDTVDIALEQGDEDLLTVNVGRLLLDCSHMLHAFETYCTRQGAASVLLSSLEKEKELLKIFLRVSQMENAVLRRMNLNSFLMVPVQRVTKYPLLLARLYKATPPHHEARELLKQAQQKIEAHLEHMNAEAKDLSATKLWRRISIINVPYRKISSEPDMNIRLRKLALEVLGWGHEESSFIMEGRLLFTQPTDSNWRKGRTIKLSHLNALLVTHGKVGTADENIVQQEALTFPRDTGIREAALLLLKEKAGRCSLLREPLSLDKCIICAELQDIEDCFEVQEIPTKDTFIFKAETTERTREWFRRLQFHAQGLGGWRRRRNALANIMMNGMIPRS